MNSIYPSWTGFDNILKLSPQFIGKEFDVLCLPENIESTNSVNDLRETIESIEIYKILKSHEINALTLHDLGVKVPFYERRCDAAYLGTLLIKDVVLPLVVVVLGNWLTGKKMNSIIHLNLKIQKPEELISIDFIGDGKTLKQIVNSLTNSENEKRKKID